MSEVIVEKVEIMEGAKVRRPYVSDKAKTGIEYVTQHFQTLKLEGVYYEDGLLVVHKFQFLDNDEIKER